MTAISMQIPTDSVSARFLAPVANWLNAHPATETTLGVIVLILAAYLTDVVAKRRILAVVSHLVRRTEFSWDDALHRRKVFERLGHIVPALVVFFGVRLVPGLSADSQGAIQHVAAAFMAAVAALAIGALLTAVNDIYERLAVARSHPIKGYTQVTKIAVYLMGAVVVVATLMNRSPLIFLSGVGAMTAVLMLVFKDTILSLVASVQIAGSGVLRVGDWVEMPKYNADGDVIDIALHTVQVQNWDKTITYIPTSKFIDDSVKNWRGMTESGARRIKRSVFLDQTAIRFLTLEEIGRFKQFALLKKYIERKQSELDDYNASLGVDVAAVNLRRLTNIGTFRAYVVDYLRNHPKIHQERTLLVRQLAPTAHGLPIEIYVFSNDTRWVEYEGIQSDIFDHVMSIIPEFGLRLFQNPSGADFKTLIDGR